MKAAALLPFLLAIGCKAPPPPLPEGAGRGLVTADVEPPPGAAIWQRPMWRVGDRFVMVRGQRLRGEFRVIEVESAAYLVDVGGGRALRRDFDLGNLGEWNLADGRPLRLMSPGDTRFHWPLWVGKRWSSEFSDRMAGGPALPMSAEYHVEAIDEIAVPAGTFEALRIVRTLRLLVPGEDFLARTQIIWYAPAAGIEVRQLLGDTLVELVELERVGAKGEGSG